jgi:hypothetical protein
MTFSRQRTAATVLAVVVIHVSNFAGLIVHFGLVEHSFVLQDGHSASSHSHVDTCNHESGRRATTVTLQQTNPGKHHHDLCFFSEHLLQNGLTELAAPASAVCLPSITNDSFRILPAARTPQELTLIAPKQSPPAHLS